MLKKKQKNWDMEDYLLLLNHCVGRNIMCKLASGPFHSIQISLTVQLARLSAGLAGPAQAEVEPN